MLITYLPNFIDIIFFFLKWFLKTILSLDLWQEVDHQYNYHRSS